MNTVIDIAQFIDMNQHMSPWDKESESYTLYTRHELTPTEFREEVQKNGNVKYRIVTEEGYKPFSYQVDKEVEILIKAAVENNYKIRIWMSKMLQPWANGAWVFAGGNRPGRTRLL